MKDVIGYEGLYAVTEDGKVYSYRTEKYLKQIEDKDGYFYVNLYKDGKRKQHKVHRLVAEAYYTKKCDSSEVNHKDENKQNNCVDNLEWCDRKYNVNYGTGHERGSRKLDKAVLCVETGEIYRSITVAFHDTNIRHIGECCNGKQYTAGGYHWRFV